MSPNKIAKDEPTAKAIVKVSPKIEGLLFCSSFGVDMEMDEGVVWGRGWCAVGVE